jgi:NAD(P)-dependent dehydrogenase (short-subunit alcohol dehydrogenase family)
MTARMLENKIIVVIGGTTGIGYSAAKALVSSGAKVVAVGRNADNALKAEREIGPSLKALAADATHPETAALAIETALRHFGAFHGLYHVAGGSGRRMGDGPLHEISDAGWEYTIQLNLTSVLYSNRAAVRQFLTQKSGGSVLNLGSVLGSSPSPRYFSTHTYAATKAAIIGLTRSAASYYAEKNIRFNVLAPALVETPMAQRAANDPEILQFIATKQPLDGGRIGQASDLDAAAIFFLSDASRFVTGQVLAIDGGWEVSEGQIPPPGNKGSEDALPNSGAA